MDNQNNRNKQNLPGNNNPNNKNNRQRWNVILFTVMLISFIVFALYQFREDTDADVYKRQAKQSVGQGCKKGKGKRNLHLPCNQSGISKGGNDEPDQMGGTGCRGF